MNHLGEIAYLTRLATPTVALVNNAGTAHIGELGSLEAIARAKGEIYEGLGDDRASRSSTATMHSPTTGAAWLNAGRRWWISASTSRRRCRRATNWPSAGSLVTVATPESEFVVTLQVPGLHNVATRWLRLPRPMPWESTRRRSPQACEYRGAKGRLQRKRLASRRTARSTTPTTPIRTRCKPRSPCWPRMPDAQSWCWATWVSWARRRRSAARGGRRVRQARRHRRACSRSAS